MVTGIAEFVNCFGHEIPYGTGFSGCDIVSKILAELGMFFKDVFDIDCSFSHKWACESTGQSPDQTCIRVFTERLSF